MDPASPLSSFLFPLAQRVRLFLGSFILGILFVTHLAGETLIFPPAALSDLAKLGADRIAARWNPRSIPDGYFPVVEGYYVVYNHENLSLFFGPVSEEKDAIRTQEELAKIRSDFIRKNPALSSSTIGRININFGDDSNVAQNTPPPGGFKPIRVYSGDSTLELDKARGGIELETPTTEDPYPSTYVIANDSDPPESPSIPPKSQKGESTAPETRKESPETGILRIVSQGDDSPAGESDAETGKDPREDGVSPRGAPTPTNANEPSQEILKEAEIGEVGPPSDSGYPTRKAPPPPPTHPEPEQLEELRELEEPKEPEEREDNEVSGESKEMETSEELKESPHLRISVAIAILALMVAIVVFFLLKRS